MPNIIKTYTHEVAPLRLIGKKYTNSDRVDGNFGAKWHEWFENGWFDVIGKNIDKTAITIDDENDGSVGFMRGMDENFEYWIGLITPENTPVPDGFEYVDLPKGELAVCFVQGKENTVFFQEMACSTKLEAEGFKLRHDSCFERYNHPRFTVPDEDGNRILDICFYLDK